MSRALKVHTSPADCKAYPSNTEAHVRDVLLPLYERLRPLERLPRTDLRKHGDRVPNTRTPVNTLRNYQK